MSKSKKQHQFGNIKPFWKSTSFYVCIALICFFIAIAIVSTVFIAIRWSYYTGAVNAVIDALEKARAEGLQQFTVEYEGKLLQYYTSKTNVQYSIGAPSIIYDDIEYCLTTTFLVSDFDNVHLESADLEIWMYMTKTPDALLYMGTKLNKEVVDGITQTKKVTSSGYTFLPFIYGNNSVAVNTGLYVITTLSWVLGFIFVIPVIVMGVNHSKLVKLHKEKIQKEEPNIGVEEYIEAETQMNHKYIEQTIQKELAN